MINQLIKEVSETLHRCWSMGWNEANGGNLSLRIDKEKYTSDITQYQKSPNLREIPLAKAESDLAGEIFIVSGTGQYFRHAIEYPEQVLGLVEIAQDGKSYKILWGFEGEGRATSEFPTHLAGHRTRLKQAKGSESLILHCHPPELISLSFTMPLNSSLLTEALWKKMPECIVIFPDGVHVLEPLLPGTVKIADRTAEKMEMGRIVLWAHHGIFVSEKTLDSAFGLVETIEKAAAIHRKILSCGTQSQTISKALLIELKQAFNLDAHQPFLDDIKS
ncbi:MAG: rhamnulose-1-phosphate aldolase [Alphaproteobacteria bacterium]